MKTIGNILWHIPFLGFLSALSYFLFGGFLVLTVVAAPIGLVLIQYAKFLLLPYHYEMVNQSELNIQKNSAWTLYRNILKIIYFPFGVFASIITLFQIVVFSLSIIGIPLAIVLAKSLSTILSPVGKVCVPQFVGLKVKEKKDMKKAEKYINSL